ncbi:SDR family oxidoreductase [Gorillibacterium massiliense]|uniref:SDR family oxidoreductase n=1 Tax=Gorillibacterium massiliense TaxID=1280390 RepID=UPI0004AFCE5A|nr:SDR family oxidoreductase [Gorillibacterium massiliense]
MLANQKIVIIGGSSGIGLETGKQALALGAEVVIASRSPEKLNQAKAHLGGQTTALPLNTMDEQEVAGFFAQLGPFDHLVVSAAETGGGAFLQEDSAKARFVFESKFWGQYYSTKYAAPYLSPNGSITLFSGVVAYKATAGSAVLGAANAAVSQLAAALALELAPIRVNAVSPGIIDTPSRSRMSAEARNAFYTSIGEKLPAKRVGQAGEVARSVMYLIQNSFVTGTVLHTDGGHRLI